MQGAHILCMQIYTSYMSVGECAIMPVHMCILGIFVYSLSFTGDQNGVGGVGLGMGWWSS